MSKLRVQAFGISLDGYGAGPGQDLDNPMGGGVSIVRQYLRSRLVDEMHVAINPTLLGAGEHLFGELDLPALGYECGELVPGARATHAVIRKRK